MKDGMTIETWPIMSENGLWDFKTKEMRRFLIGYGASLTEELPNGQKYQYEAESEKSAAAALKKILAYVESRIEEYSNISDKLKEMIYGEGKV